jgi:predicted glycosyltransferase
MKILVEITHPAHVHFFRNAIGFWKKEGHDVFISARDKDIIIDLLVRYGLEHKILSRMYTKKLGLMVELLIHESRVFKIARRFKPDIIVSIAGVMNVHAAKLLKIPTIVFTDTEHAKLSNLLTFPFADVICTPSCYLDDLGDKQIRYDGYHELAYLHPNYFRPDGKVLDLLGLKEGEKFVIMRFVSWRASHDIGHRGLSIEMKRKSVQELSKYAKIFITSEEKLPQDLEPYQIRIPPEKIHDALYYATMYFGMSGTMATESAVLGIPSIHITYPAVTKLGNFVELEKEGLMYNFTDIKMALNKASEILRDSSARSKWNDKKQKLLKDKIDVTAFMVWFIENYPESVKIMEEDSNYQLRFR